MLTDRSVTCTIWSSVRPAISVSSLPSRSLSAVDGLRLSAVICLRVLRVRQRPGATVASAAGSACTAGVAAIDAGSTGSAFEAHGRQMSSTTATMMSARMPRKA